MNTLPQSPPVLYPLSLRDAMRDDVSTVFFNLDEFAEEMMVNGVLVPALWGENLHPTDNGSRSDPTGWGIVSQIVELLLREGDILLPFPDEEIVVDDLRYTVLKTTPQSGVLRLELERLSA